MRFGYWATNLGGLLFSAVDQPTGSDFAANAALARSAEAAGFDMTLVAARFIATAGGTPDLHEALTTSAALAAVTTSLHIVAAVHPGLWHPAMVAKAAATIDALSGGRFSLNIVSGWFKDEFLRLGEPWLEHDERYRRSIEFIEVLKGLWAGEAFSFEGRFYRVDAVSFRPRPAAAPRPRIYQGGNSTAARAMAAGHTDWYLMNGATPQEAGRQIAEIRSLAAACGREVKFGINGFAIVRGSEDEALAELRTILSLADAGAVEAFAGHVREAGASTADRVGMWANSDVANLVQPNDGFKTGLIGTPRQVIERIRAYEAVGVDLMLLGFRDFASEITAFGQAVIGSFRR